jgi:predicted nucleotidyltransferase
MAEARTRTVDDLPSDWKVSRLAAILREHLAELRERYHVDDLALFGSYVRNEQRPDSDLDLLVTFSRTPSLFELMHAEDELEALLGVPVELVLRRSLQPRLARYVLREAVPL